MKSYTHSIFKELYNIYSMYDNYWPQIGRLMIDDYDYAK